jgi:hypothetical protein
MVPLSKVIQIIVNATRDLGRRYDTEINQQQQSLPWLIDRAAFATIGRKLTHYALKLVMVEWSATKWMADEIEEGEREDIDYNAFSCCISGCELPVRYGLPCRHWMYRSIQEEEPLPLSLFHPRWHFDGPSSCKTRREAA